MKTFRIIYKKMRVITSIKSPIIYAVLTLVIVIWVATVIGIRAIVIGWVVVSTTVSPSGVFRLSFFGSLVLGDILGSGRHLGIFDIVHGPTTSPALTIVVAVVVVSIAIWIVVTIVAMSVMFIRVLVDQIVDREVFRLSFFGYNGGDQSHETSQYNLYVK